MFTMPQRLDRLVWLAFVVFQFALYIGMASPAWATAPAMTGFAYADGGKTAFSDARDASMSCSGPSTSVSPCGTHVTQSTNKTGLQQTFTITNNGEAQDTYDLSCTRSGLVTSCSVTSFVTIRSGSSASVTVTYSTGSTVGSGVLSLNATGTDDSPTGYVNVDVTAPGVPPAISLSPHSENVRNRSLCAAGCFDATLSYSTPAYLSLDTPRSVTLFYSSDQARPRVTIEIDVNDASPTPPSQTSLRLKRPDGSYVTFANGVSETYFTGGSGWSRLAAQFDASSLTTGAYSYTLVVRSHFSDGTVKESTAPIRVLVNNEASSPMGAGWTIAGWQRLYPQADGGVVISDGAGSLSYFAPSGTSGSYISPAGDFSTLLYNSTTSKYYRNSPGGPDLDFGSDGKLISVSDRFNSATYSYDANGRPYQITDPAGKSITLYYDAAGKLDSIATPGGRTTRVNVNTSGDLVAITDPANVQALAVTYDSQHRAMRRTDRRGGQWGFAYDFAGKLAADTVPSVPVRGVSARPVVKYQSLEYATLNSGTGTHARVIPSNAKAHVTDANGQTTDLTLNRFGAAIGVTEPLGRVSSMTMDDSARVLAVSSPSGHLVQYSWSGPDLTKIYDVTGGSEVDLAYEPTFHEVTHVSGDAPEVFYDWSAGNLIRVRVGTDTTKYTYDSRGRVLAATDPAGHVTTHYYAASGFLNTDSLSTPGPRIWKIFRDSYGRPTTNTTPIAGESENTQYDVLNRVIRTISISDYERDTTIFTYDSLYLRSVKDAKGQLYQYSPNALGWVESRTDPTSHSESFQYDSSGNVTKATNRRGQQITFTYDALGQPTSLVADGRTTHFGTDPSGAFSAAWNSESADTTWFNDADRPDSIATWRAGRRYKMIPASNAQGAKTHLSLSGPVIGSRSLGYHYNVKSQLDTLTALDGQKTTFGYNADGQPTGVYLPGGLAISQTFISTHGQGSIAYSSSSLNDALGLRFGYDEMGRVNQRYNFAQDTMWSYTFIQGRLVHERQLALIAPTCSPGQKYGEVCTAGSYDTLDTRAWSYDKMGNQGTVTTGNRVISYVGDTLEYDLDGNTTRKHSGSADERFYWNSLGQLDSVVTDTITLRFGYDALGRRVRKQGSRGTTYMIYDGDDLLITTDAAGNSLEEYTYYPGIDRPHSMRKGGATYYYATDFTGNVTGLVLGDNTIANKYEYGAFGVRRQATEAVYNPLQYTARELDTETGLYYYRARYYDPDLGRFISEDPSGLSGGINLYAYVGNNPVNGTDPLGLGPGCGQDDLGDGYMAGSGQPVGGVTVFACGTSDGGIFNRIYAIISSGRVSWGMLGSVPMIVSRSGMGGEGSNVSRTCTLVDDPLHSACQKSITDNAEEGIGEFTGVANTVIGTLWANQYLTIRNWWRRCAVNVMEAATTTIVGAATAMAGRAASNFGTPGTPVGSGVGRAGVAGGAVGAGAGAVRAFATGNGC